MEQYTTEVLEEMEGKVRGLLSIVRHHAQLSDDGVSWYLLKDRHVPYLESLFEEIDKFYNSTFKGHLPAFDELNKDRMVTQLESLAYEIRREIKRRVVHHEILLQEKTLRTRWLNLFIGGTAIIVALTVAVLSYVDAYEKRQDYKRLEERVRMVELWKAGELGSNKEYKIDDNKVPEVSDKQGDSIYQRGVRRENEGIKALQRMRKGRQGINNRKRDDQSSTRTDSRRSEKADSNESTGASRSRKSRDL